MFWQKKNKINHRLFGLSMFGLIAFGIILSTVLLVVILVHKVGTVDLVKNKIDQSPITPAVVENINEKLFSVQENYFSQVKALILAIDELNSADQINDQIENLFFSVRVPIEKRDDHLQTLIKINTTLKDKNIDLATAKIVVKENLKNLLADK